MKYHWRAALKTAIALIVLAGWAQQSVLLSVPLIRNTQDNEFAFADAPPELVARRKNILEEANSTGTTEWAGRYAADIGEDSNRTLMWGPRSGYILFHYMDAPVPFDLSVGRAAIDGEHLRLYPETPIPKLPHPSYRDSFNLVRWGKGHYLVSESDMVAFCFAINSTSREEIGRFLRKREEVSDPRGYRYPTLPASYDRYLRHLPITVSVVHVQSDRIPREREYPGYRVKATFNAGTKQDVQPGMVFWQVDGQRRTRLKFRVSTVKEMTSEADLVGAWAVETVKSYLPRIGDRYRNRPRKADRSPF